MTVLQIQPRDLAIGGDEPAASGVVSVVYRDAERAVTDYLVDGAKVVFAREITVAFKDGTLLQDLDAPPTIPNRVYARITITNTTTGRRVVARNVLIPDSDSPVAFGDLELIDPKTLAPVVLTPTLLETITTVAREALQDRF